MRKLLPFFLIFIAVFLAGCAKEKEVFGTLVQVNGDPAAEIKLTLCLNNKADGTCDFKHNILFETKTAKNGTFKFENVPDGKYYILFTPPDSPAYLEPLRDNAGDPIAIEMVGGKPVDLKKLVIRTSWMI